MNATIRARARKNTVNGNDIATAEPIETVEPGDTCIPLIPKMEAKKLAGSWYLVSHLIPRRLRGRAYEDT